MRVVAIRVKNFKALRDVSMKDIPGFAVMVGANGTGKSTFIGVFDFLKDCLKNDVRVALRKRGGFAQVVSRGHEDEAIEIELQVRMGIEAIRRQRLVTYHLRIVEENRRIAVAEESLRFKRGAGGAPYHFIRCNYLPPLSATFVEAVNGLFLQGDGDCDERVVSARCHGLEVARYPAVRFRKCHGAEAA